MTLRVTISRTSRGDQDYLQVMSDDMVSVNIVLIADKIEVTDARRQPREAKHGGTRGSSSRRD